MLERHVTPDHFAPPDRTVLSGMGVEFEAYAAFERELLKDLIPFIEADIRTKMASISL